MSATIDLDYKSIDKVTETVQKFADGSKAESIINEYLAGEGGDLLKTGIHELLPVSGRSWSGKAVAASATDPFQKTAGNLSVRVHTKNRYHYLYFPDDGASSKKHAGMQRFMFRGAQAKSAEIGENIVNKLLERLED